MQTDQKPIEQDNQKTDGVTPPPPPLFLVDKRCTMLRKMLRSTMRQKFSRITRSVDMDGRVPDVEYAGFMASVVYEELLDLCLTGNSSEPFSAFMYTMQFFNENLRSHNELELQKKGPSADVGEDKGSPAGRPDTH